MKEQLSLFKNKLEEFAQKHKSDIRKDPVFRAQFHVMCANIGVDPLASNKVGGRAAACSQTSFTTEANGAAADSQQHCRTHVILAASHALKGRMHHPLRHPRLFCPWHTINV